MIVEAILTFFFNIIGTLLSALPSWSPLDLSSMTADLNSGVAGTVFKGLGWLNYYVPVDTMLLLLTILFATWGATYLVRFILWILSLLHISGNS